jgi:serine/threonine protein kinase
VAIKVMEALDSADEMAVRLRAEARGMAHLEHPGIVPIHDVGSLPDGRVFYAMKLVHGTSLESPRLPDPSVSEKMRVSLKACDAVGFAHAHGIIHRDLKPANLMLGACGEVLVMDWGVAKVLPEIGGNSEGAAKPASASRSGAPGQVASVHTAAGTVMGTPSFMAPEQALDRAHPCVSTKFVV